ncbi:hypothetical protein BP6252_04957 [Coleophoma cylindrospora]|uniref:Heterokaryon incompatibility domain-containing protein n=1 Tax=Coleophoma cylindrospora TaxID=1849047 RepID=A0A3D8S215_9HELO|nr:hypothetical protein BP6252_04957 [Coleophoma cylindrospora]
MCLANGEHADRPFGDSNVAESPILRFAEPFVTAHVNDDRNDDTTTSGRAYDVGVNSPLGLPKDFPFMPLPPFEESRTENDEALPWKTGENFEGCQNQHLPQLSTAERDDDHIARSWPKGYNMKYLGFKTGLSCVGREIFAKIFTFAFLSRVRECNSSRCQARKTLFAKSVPSCEWPAFSDYVLTLIACGNLGNGLDMILQRLIPENKFPRSVQAFCIDIRGMLEILIWSRNFMNGHTVGLFELQNSLSTSRDNLSALWDVLSPQYEAKALEYAARCHRHGICPTRIWNISFQSSYGVNSISHIAEMALVAEPPSSKTQHLNCTDQHCSLSIMNSTLVKQAHKCPRENCEEMEEFHPDILNEAFKNSIRDDALPCIGAWQTRSSVESEEPRRLCSIINSNYMAISHVWSDGTGVGLSRQPGMVNKCLSDYFERIATTLGCNGIWWDTISLPTERESKTVAINNMLQNYEKAKVVLVHDEDLVKFTWVDDGSPAIALVLSSWFTRGWTAAELWSSRHVPVKVLFANPAAGKIHEHGSPQPQYMTADLDKDILAGNLTGWSRYGESYARRPAPRLGHIIATNILMLLRSEDFAVDSQIFKTRLSSLIKVLRQRVTSWSRDRMIIAGMMGLRSEKFDSNSTTVQITQELLKNVNRIKTTELIHGEVPISLYGGPWEWCPQSIFDLGLAFSGSDPTNDFCDVREHGTLSGKFLAYKVQRNYSILPYGSHPAHKARITVALSQRQHCLLLTTTYIVKRRIFILFQPRYVEECIIVGHWIGCVTLQEPPDVQSPIRFEMGSQDTQTLRDSYSLPSDTSFEFGANTGLSKAPLPSISIHHLTLTVQASRRSHWGADTKWVFSEESDKEQDEVWQFVKRTLLNASS